MFFGLVINVVIGIGRWLYYDFKCVLLKMDWNLDDSEFVGVIVYWLELFVCVRVDDLYMEDVFDGLKLLWVEVMVLVVWGIIESCCDGVKFLLWEVMVYVWVVWGVCDGVKVLLWEVVFWVSDCNGIFFLFVRFIVVGFFSCRMLFIFCCWIDCWSFKKRRYCFECISIFEGCVKKNLI